MERMLIMCGIYGSYVSYASYAAAALTACDDFFRAIGERIRADDRQAALADHLFPQFDIRALEADHQRNAEAGLRDRREDAGGDDVALHDAAEDIDQDAADLGIAEDDLEGGGDLLLARAAADIEEVRRLAAVVFDDVHGGHGEARRH